MKRKTGLKREQVKQQSFTDLSAANNDNTQRSEHI